MTDPASQKNTPALRTVFQGKAMAAEERRCFLEGQGLQAFVLNDHVASMGVYGPTSVVVPSDQYDRAASLIKEFDQNRAHPSA